MNTIEQFAKHIASNDGIVVMMYFANNDQ